LVGPIELNIIDLLDTFNIDAPVVVRGVGEKASC